MLACGLIARFAGIFLAINGILIMDLPGDGNAAHSFVQFTFLCQGCSFS